LFLGLLFLSWKFSPDCSGYAILQGFEVLAKWHLSGKRGARFKSCFIVSASKKTKSINLQININELFF